MGAALVVLAGLFILHREMNAKKSISEFFRLVNLEKIIGINRLDDSDEQTIL